MSVGDQVTRSRDESGDEYSAWGMCHVGLMISCRYVLQAIARPPNNRMSQFGIIALDRFQHRLPEWPQYCARLKGIQNLTQALPGMHDPTTCLLP